VYFFLFIPGRGYKPCNPILSNSNLSNPNLSMMNMLNYLYYRMPNTSNTLKIERPKTSNDLKDRKSILIN
jgi:hypothetical protein